MAGPQPLRETAKACRLILAAGYWPDAQRESSKGPSVVGPRSHAHAADSFSPLGRDWGYSSELPGHSARFPIVPNGVLRRQG